MKVLGPTWATGFPNGIQKLFYGNLFPVVQVSLPPGATDAARPVAAPRISVCVFWRVFVSALAMRLSPSHVGVGLNRERQPSLVSRVKRLFAAGCPPAVTGFVVAVVVGPTVERMGWRGFWSHISNEVSEANSARFHDSPALAHGDPASTPILKVLAVGVRATLRHVGPCVVQGLCFGVSHTNNGITVTTGLNHATL